MHHPTNQRLSIFGLLLLLPWVSSSSEYGNHVLSQIYFDHGEMLHCEDLVATNDAQDGFVQGSICFDLAAATKTDEMVVEIEVSTDGWEFDSVFFWLGNDVSLIPSSSNSNQETQIGHDPFYQQKSVKQRKITLTVPIQQTLGFACSSPKEQQWAALNTTIQSFDNQKQQTFQIIQPPDPNKDKATNLFPFTLSCNPPPDQLSPKKQRLRNNFPLSTTTTSRKLRVCPPFPSLDSIAFNFTRQDIQTIYEATKLNLLVSRVESGRMSQVLKKNRGTHYQVMEGWADVNDQAIVAKPISSDQCFIAFMGTEGFNPFDQFQNLDLRNHILPDTDCEVRNGYFDAYNTSYKIYQRQALHQCLQSCGDGNQCPLVITGHSQGGAAAIVAAIDLRKYNPLIITTGAPRPIMYKETTLPCTDFPADRHYRFINTVGPPAFYDGVPMGESSGSTNFGIPILLDEVNLPLCSPGFNDDTSRGPELTLLHGITEYQEKLYDLLERGCFPTPVGKWETGHYCNYKDECASSVCVDGACR